MPSISSSHNEEALVSWALSGAQQGTGDRANRAAQRDLQILLLHQRGQTAREIATAVGASHTTVLRTLTRFKEHEHGRT
jgi:transposase-like protein